MAKRLLTLAETAAALELDEAAIVQNLPLLAEWRCVAFLVSGWPITWVTYAEEDPDIGIDENLRTELAVQAAFEGLLCLTMEDAEALVRDGVVTPHRVGRPRSPRSRVWGEVGPNVDVREHSVRLGDLYFFASDVNPLRSALPMVRAQFEKVVDARAQTRPAELRLEVMREFLPAYREVHDQFKKYQAQVEVLLPLVHADSPRHPSPKASPERTVSEKTLLRMVGGLKMWLEDVCAELARVPPPRSGPARKPHWQIAPRGRFSAQALADGISATFKDRFKSPAGEASGLSKANLAKALNAVDQAVGSIQNEVDDELDTVKYELAKSR